MFDEKRTQNADDIIVLRGLEPVWQNPARFIGDLTSKGLHHLVDEILSNSTDEAMSGYAKNIDVVLYSDNIISIQDDGRGIPTELHSTEKISALELVMTTLDAGGKMQKKAYEYSGGLHGVGLSVVNALSDYLEVEVRRNNNKYFQRYENGKPISKIAITGKTKRTGTKITFKPAEKFFVNAFFKSAIISNKLRELAFINKGIKFTFTQDGMESEEYVYEDGLSRYISEINLQREILPKEVVSYTSFFELKEEDEKFYVDVAWQYNDSNFEKIKTYANSINTPDGGTHELGFRLGFTKAVNDFIEEKFKAEKLDPIFIREGLTALISIKLKRPEFENQTKTKLSNNWVKVFISKFVYEKTYEFLSNNVTIAREIFNKVNLAFKASEAAKRAKALVRRKNLLDNITALPGKMADCEVRDASKAELFIVEGDSAGGSAKQARNRKFQAILPLKGKILNVERKHIDDILKNEEIKSMIQAIGCGVENNFDIKKLRYNKIVIMTDADSDGSHIRNLLLTFFYRMMPEVIKMGNLYIAQPPLYRVKERKNEKYLKNENELNKLLSNILEEYCEVSNSNSYRFSKNELKVLIKELINYNSTLEHLAVSKEKLLIDFILRFTFIRKESLLDHQNLKLVKDELNSYIPLIERMYSKLSPIKLSFGSDEDDNLFFTFQSFRDGRMINSTFNLDFFTSPEFKKIESFFQKIKKLDKPLYYIELIDKGTVIPCTDLIELLESLTDLAKSKVEIQRYKGLGEMNPEQLWQTTMNPSSRSILKVVIDDEDAADNLTYMLMGDSVEQRKVFIDINALKVRNLDV